MWSIGCILGELIIGKPVFPGTSTLNQIERIIELIGKPLAEDIEALESQISWDILRSINVTQRKSFSKVFEGDNE